MAEAQRDLRPITGAKGAHLVIIEGRYYDALNDMLLAGAKRAIAAAGATCEIITVPGALEIPVAMAIRHQPRAFQKAADGFVALGIVIRGETTHYEIVSVQANRALIDYATQNALPFGNAILTVENDAQAEARANPEKGDKGGDAARAALTLIALKAKATA
ncbi:MAG: 6,7-dimethyl-8-ribityllumazine synthase [Rhizobiales bacterium]|nr:6,7-dimethyl-8-ribityllumazine synthase [Hyphomicrobiales bacterium]